MYPQLKRPFRLDENVSHDTPQNCKSSLRKQQLEPWINTWSGHVSWNHCKLSIYVQKQWVKLRIDKGIVTLRNRLEASLTRVSCSIRAALISFSFSLAECTSALDSFSFTTKKKYYKSKRTEVSYYCVKICVSSCYRRRNCTGTVGGVIFTCDTLISPGCELNQLTARVAKKEGDFSDDFSC